MVSLTELADFVVDPDECDPELHQAAFNGDAERVEALLRDEDYRELVNVRVRPFGATPLRLAATGGFVPCVRLLLANGAEVDLTDYKEQTPLFVAVKDHRARCAEVLLEAGANPNGDWGNRCTPLYIACQSGFLDGVKLLLHYGAMTELPARLTFGSIPGLPLHIAVLYRHFDCFLELLLRGAEPDLRRVRPPLPAEVLAQVSLAHAVVRSRCPAIYARVLRAFGGNLWQRDARNRLAVELVVADEDDCGGCESRRYIQEAMSEPCQLLFQCRLAIRRHLGRPGLPFLANLPLPPRLLRFLQHKELTDTDDAS